MQTLRIGRQFRSFAITREAVNVEKRTMEVAFSSEAPVDRWYGGEVLGHKAGEVNLTWLSGGTAPLLADHDTDEQIGVVERAWIGNDMKGRAVVRFGSSDRAARELQDAADGIRGNISVGYSIEEIMLVSADGGASDPENPVYRATKWTPWEISLVALPADTSVGVGRKKRDDVREVPIINLPQTRAQMATENTETPKPAATAAAAVVAPAIDREAIEAEIRASVRAELTGETQRVFREEAERAKEIRALGAQHQQQALADDHVIKGTPLAEFRGVLLSAIPAGTPLAKPATDLSLSDKEQKEYSFVRMLDAAASVDRGGSLKSLAPFELECSQEIAKRLKQEPRGFFVPMDVQRQKFQPDQKMMSQRTTLQAGTNNVGGYTVATELWSQDFITLYRNAMMVRAMGATVLSGLVGNIAFPKQTAAGTATWVAESGAPSATNQTFGQVTISPKTVAAYTDMSRQLLKQSTIDVENMVRTDLSLVMALAIDLAALHGTGASNQPTGIAATSGIGNANAGNGTDGGAPSWAQIVALETAVAVANAAVGSMGYLTNTKARGKLKTTDKTSGYGQFLWAPSPMSLQNGGGELNGYRAEVSNQVSSTLTKGASSAICSAIFFGNWSDLIVGEWGVLDILVNPFTGASAGDVRIHTFQSVDVAVRRAASFAASLDVLTT